MCGPANATRTIVHLNVVDLRDGVRWNVIDASRLSCVCVCARARTHLLRPRLSFLRKC